MARKNYNLFKVILEYCWNEACQSASASAIQDALETKLLLATFEGIYTNKERIQNFSVIHWSSYQRSPESRAIYVNHKNFAGLFQTLLRRAVDHRLYRNLNLLLTIASKTIEEYEQISVNVTPKRWSRTNDALNVVPDGAPKHTTAADILTSRRDESIFVYPRSTWSDDRALADPPHICKMMERAYQLKQPKKEMMDSGRCYYRKYRTLIEELLASIQNTLLISIALNRPTAVLIIVTLIPGVFNCETTTLSALFLSLNNRCCRIERPILPINPNFFNGTDPHMQLFVPTRHIFADLPSEPLAMPAAGVPTNMYGRYAFSDNVQAFLLEPDESRATGGRINFNQDFSPAQRAALRQFYIELATAHGVRYKRVGPVTRISFDYDLVPIPWVDDEDTACFIDDEDDMIGYTWIQQRQVPVEHYPLAAAAESLNMFDVSFSMFEIMLKHLPSRMLR